MRKDKLRVTLTVEGRDCGVFSKRTGGGVDSDETKYRPGAGMAKISLGGQRDPQNVTLTGLATLENKPIRDWIEQHAGEGRALVKEQPLGPDNNPWGEPKVWPGTVKAYTPPDADTHSSDAAEFEVEISTEE
jgi:hypothetical protein